MDRRIAYLALFASALAGCPIYGGGSADDEDCVDCNRYECFSPSDCANGEVCGTDQLCHVGQCDYWGCGAGYRCDVIAIDVYTCVPDNSSSTSSSGSGGAGGQAASTFCGNPDDCAASETCAPDGQCQPGDCVAEGCIFGFSCDPTASPAVCESTSSNACGSDIDCAGDTFSTKCLSGFCMAPDFWCYDGSQCAPGDRCADGKCVPSCANGETCPAGFACDTLGLCTDAETPCSITADCGSATTVCVDGSCVPRSLNGTCPGPAVWVENGCVPNQLPLAACGPDGQQDSCQPGSICVNHSCYVSCDAPNQDACQGLPSTDVCQSITTMAGTFGVCGDGSGFGGDCDLTQGLSCSANQTCVDGHCL